MSHKIPGCGQRRLPGNRDLHSVTAAGVARPAGAPVEVVAPSRDAILLIDKARLLRKLEAAVRRAPAMEMSHVLRVMDALARNEYVVDSQRVADKLLKHERDLAGRK